MPARFVEILDVHAEANTLFKHLTVKASGIAANLQFNISDYINATSGVFDARVIHLLERYNMSKDDVFQAMSSLNLQMSNTTFAQLETPRPIPKYLMTLGSAFIIAHLVIVHVQSRNLVRQYGHHCLDKM